MKVRGDMINSLFPPWGNLFWAQHHCITECSSLDILSRIITIILFILKYISLSCFWVSPHFSNQYSSVLLLHSVLYLLLEINNLLHWHLQSPQQMIKLICVCLLGEITHYPFLEADNTGTHGWNGVGGKNHSGARLYQIWDKDQWKASNFPAALKKTGKALTYSCYCNNSAAYIWWLHIVDYLFAVLKCFCAV